MVEADEAIVRSGGLGCHAYHMCDLLAFVLFCGIEKSGFERWTDFLPVCRTSLRPRPDSDLSPYPTINKRRERSFVTFIAPQ
jgi:hypothetical protein